MEWVNISLILFPGAPLQAADLNAVQEPVRGSRATQTSAHPRLSCGFIDGIEGRCRRRVEMARRRMRERNLAHLPRVRKKGRSRAREGRNRPGRTPSGPPPP